MKPYLLLTLVLLTSITSFGQSHCTSVKEYSKNMHITGGSVKGHPYTTFDRHRDGYSLDNDIQKIRSQILKDKYNDAPVYIALPPVYAMINKLLNPGTYGSSVMMNSTEHDDLIEFLSILRDVYDNDDYRTIMHIVSKEITKTYQISSYPTFLIIVQDGSIQYRYEGYNQSLFKDLDNQIIHLLNTKP